MRPARRLLAGALFVALLAAFAMPAASDAALAPMVLLLHGGGWQSGGAAEMSPWSDEFQAYGYRTRSLDYPLGNVMASIDYVDAIAQQERAAGAPVIAYGISAGGTIAAALAARGRVDGAVDVIGPTDFRNWVSPIGLQIILNTHMTSADERAASPYLRLDGHQTPQLLQCGLADPITTYDQCMRYVSAAAQGNPDTALQPMIDAHDQWPVDRKRALLWVQARWPAPAPDVVSPAPAPTKVRSRPQTATVTGPARRKHSSSRASRTARHTASARRPRARGKGKPAAKTGPPRR